MILMTQWAQKWGVPVEAIRELETVLGAIATPKTFSTNTPEEENQSRIRIEASKQGKRLFRNNVGAGKLQNGSFVRWGLANDSTTVNKRCKSSDLIGISPVMITKDHVGHIFGQFIAREVKRSSWRYRGTEEEEAQLAFLTLVASLGGDARFTNSPDGDL